MLFRSASVLTGFVAAACAAASYAHAQNNYPWCSNFHDGAGVNCGFVSEEQCQATARGSGGFCTPNNMYHASGAAPAMHAAAHSRHLRK
jgi:hypothetical protein